MPKPIDAAFQHAMDTRMGADTLSPGRHNWCFLDVAMTPITTSLRLNKAPCADPALLAAWDPMRAALAQAWPQVAWPVGLRLRADAHNGAWQRWALHSLYLFGHAFEPKRFSIQDSGWRWGETNSGFDDATAHMQALQARVPPSNATPARFNSVHTMMGSPFMQHQHVVARSQAEAMAKLAWARHGIAGIDALLDPKRPQKHKTWLVAVDIADPDGDGFAQPQDQDDALNALKACTPTGP